MTLPWLVALALFASRAQADSCPNSSISFQGCPAVLTQAAAVDTSCGAALGPWGHGHFDLLADTLGLSVSPEFGAWNGQVAAAERYRIVGAPPGTLVAFTLRMPITASLYAYPSDIHTRASGTAALELDGVVLAQASQVRDCPDFFSCTSTGNLGTALTAALSIPAGQEFVVIARLSASVSGNILNPGSAAIEGGIRFDDLPAGIGVVTCHGDTIGTVDVHDGSARGGLRFVSTGSNPSRGPIPVAFFASRAGPVTLSLLDIAGRAVESTRLEVSAAGLHALTLGVRRSLAPGIYVVRLTQGAESQSRLMTVVR